MKRTVCIVILIVSLFHAAPVLSAAPRTGTVLSADSISIHYSIVGDGTPAIVFVHCWCCDREYWKHQIPHFAKNHTVVAIDLAGHGSSGLGRDDWTLDAFARDVASVVRALDLDRVILVGHSMGGPVALEAARLVGDKAIGVVGVDTYQDFGRTLSEEQRAQFLMQFEADFPGMTRRFVHNMFPPEADSVLVGYVVEDMASAPPEVGIGVMRNMLTYDPVPTVGTLTIPIYAINSQMFPTNVEGNKELARSFEARFMPDVGHFVMLENPELFNELLDEVVRELAGRK